MKYCYWNYIFEWVQSLSYRDKNKWCNKIMWYRISSRFILKLGNRKMW